MSANEKPKEKVNKSGMIVNKGGTRLGGEGEGDGDVAAQRAARFEAEREKSKNRGVSKES